MTESDGRRESDINDGFEGYPCCEAHSGLRECQKVTKGDVNYCQKGSRKRVLGAVLPLVYP